MKSLLSVFLFLVSAAVLAAVNINTANQQELESLQGIGPAKARAIIQYREQHGPFTAVRDLRRVPGFGEKTVRKLEKDLIVSGPTVIEPHL
ncbi:MAG: ComEA family DNA-binding protein [Paludibacterium sp.]|uniref:ComEA family DNA-binding protein n=1 Tax=Paludibacterium sp. TaxID=1917523 RepID=UPI0025D47422|nr:ComEA family DNA-binding protein [Paludibacterium sp.]MBV8048452.1 ComEA family DNA-binding protein [Paludibacterium sp.]MBV8647383.1 ComEA family DNA-binding protein [Paludibacterium sp.]